VAVSFAPQCQPQSMRGPEYAFDLEWRVTAVAFARAKTERHRRTQAGDLLHAGT
jgi:hypothetical protein